MERSVFKMLSMLRLPETRVCLAFAVVTTILVLLNKHLIQDPFSQDVKNVTSSSDWSSQTGLDSDGTSAVTFDKEHCDLQGLAWYPEPETNSWLLRAPYFLVIGGDPTQSSILTNALRQHPKVLEVPLFLPNVSGSTKTRVKDARWQLRNQRSNFINDDGVIGFDTQPNYLFAGGAPYSVLCAFPWVNIIIIVQHPIERIISSWKSINRQESVDEWIDEDMKHLRRSGVVKDWNKTDQFAFSNSLELDAAWQKYSSESEEWHPDRPVGRSLYSVQLRHWFRAIRKAGRKPKDSILIVTVEDLESRPMALYNRLLDWLRLSPETTTSFPRSTLIPASNEMTPATRNRLAQFLKPYNDQTYELLKGSWKGIWDVNSEERKNVLTWPQSVTVDETNDKTSSKMTHDSTSQTKNHSQKTGGETKQTTTETYTPSMPLEHTGLASVLPVPQSMPTRNSSFSLSPLDSPDDVKNLTKLDAFVAQWCDLQGGSRFIPDEETRSWQMRAPYFILIGAKWSGVALLTSLLAAHPLVVEEKPFAKDFFLAKNFRKFISWSGKTKVFPARNFMYARHYSGIQRQLKSNSTYISFDATLSYLFFSQQIQKILCVAPWTKIVVVLRDPVEQAYSLWSDAVSLGLKSSFDEWVAADFQVMHNSGLIHDWEKVDFDSFAGSQNEENAWSEYQKKVREGVVGRGMYEIQLRLWIRALEAMGRNPQTELLVVLAERLSQSKQREFSNILQFLMIQDHQLPEGAVLSSSNYSQSMSDASRRALTQFYAPYNKRLFKLIELYHNRSGEKWTDWL